MDIGEIEREQLDYIKRHGITIPSDEEFPDQLEKSLDTPLVLTPDQEEKILKDLRQKLDQEAVKRDVPAEKVKKSAQTITFSGYVKLMSRSFVGIMDDLLNFDGDLESLSVIFTKDNRLIFVASILIVVSLVLLNNNRVPSVKPE